jgi:hypothetical protein
VLERGDRGLVIAAVALEDAESFHDGPMAGCPPRISVSVSIMMDERRRLSRSPVRRAATTRAAQGYRLQLAFGRVGVDASVRARARSPLQPPDSRLPGN